MFLHINFSSMFNGVIAATLGLIVYCCTDYPPYVVTLLLPEVPPETSQLATLLLLPLRTFCCLSEVAFRIYVYFKISNLSNVLIKVLEVKSCIFHFWQKSGRRLCKQSWIYCLIFKYLTRSGSGRMVSTLASHARGPGFKPRAGHAFLFLSNSQKSDKIWLPAR